MAEPLDPTDTTDPVDTPDTGPLYRYTLESDGYRYTLESPDDLTEEEVFKRIDPFRGSAVDEAAADQSPETRRQLLGGQEAKISDAASTSYGDIVSRRVGENIDAFRGLGVNQYQMVFGGNPEGRMKSAFDYLRGLGSVTSTVMTPLTGAVEKLGLAMGAEPETARNIGDISELPAAWLFGGLASAGKLGAPALKIVQKFGSARPMSLAGQQLQDRHLAYANAQQEMSPHEKMTLGISPVEELSRMSNQSIGDLAMAAKKPTIASVRLKQVKAEGDVWDAKVNNGDFSAAHDIPESPTYVYKPKSHYVGRERVPTAEAEFTPAERDPKFIIGTTGNAAAKTSPLAEIADNELKLGEMRVIEAKKVHHERNVAGLHGYGDDAAREAIAYRANRAKQSHITRNTDAEPNLSEPAKGIVKYIDAAIYVLNAIWRPRLRAALRPKIERQVRAEFSRGTKAWDSDWIKDNEKVIAKEVHKRVHQEIGSDWTIEDHLGELLHGDYSIIHKDGTTWRATTPQGLRQLVREIKELRPDIDLKDLKLGDKRVFLDDDLIREMGGGRIHRSVDNLLNDIGVHVDLTDMWNGTKPKGRTNYFRGMIEGKRGSKPGYAVDLIKTMDMLHGQTERLLMLSDVERKVLPIIEDLHSRNLSTMGHALERSLDSLRGARTDVAISFDRFVASNPITKAMGVQSYALERWAGGLKSVINTGFLKLSARYQFNNAGFQLLQTLWPIVDSKDMARGISLAASKEGRQILQRHGVFGIQNKVEGERLFGSVTAGKVRKLYDKVTNAGEKLNQETAFLIMYDKARRLGLTDSQAAAYGKLRGQVYSQFLGLTTDTPDLFRRADPFGILTMFQRYPVKQFEMMMDIVRDKNFPGAAKWLAVNFMMGGARASAMGNAGWLTHKMYEDIKRRYGETVAGIFHSGLPSLIGIDQAASVMFLNPPFGSNWQEKLGRLVSGVLGSVTGSVIGAAYEKHSPEPYAARRAFNALIEQVPAFRELKGIIDLMEGDYDLRTPGGRLKYHADAKALIKRILGAKPLREATEDTAIQAFMEVKQRRDHMLDFIAARRGQAQIAGISLGDDVENELQKQMDSWNALWPDFPITEPDIRKRGEMIAESTREEQKFRMMQNQPKALQRHPMFDDFRINRLPGGESGGGG